MQIKTTYSSGFTLVEIMIVVAIIGLLAAVAIPNFIRSRIKSQQKACINNLRQYEGASQQYALENKLPSTDPYTMDDLKPFIHLSTGDTLPECPSQGSYVPGDSIAELPTCTITGHSL